MEKATVFAIFLFENRDASPHLRAHFFPSFTHLNFTSPPLSISLPPLGADAAHLVNYCHLRLVRTNRAQTNTKSTLTQTKRLGFSRLHNKQVTLRA